MLALRAAGPVRRELQCSRSCIRTPLALSRRCARLYTLSSLSAAADSGQSDQTEETPRHKRTSNKTIPTNIARSLQTQLARARDEPSAVIYARLAKHAAWGRVESVEQLVRYLVSERGEQPNSRLYSALVAVNVNPENGSLFRVKAVIQEMLEEGLNIDVGLCHDILKVLSVHLDYLLRDDVLEYMRSRWLSISPSGQQDVVAGLLREGQLEVAQEKLNQMRGNGIEIPGWLQEMFIYALLECGEIDEGLAQIRARVERGELDISKSVWSHLLEIASAVYYHDAVGYVWSRQVNLGYLNPSAGVCLNALTAAARKGDTELATDVFTLLGKRAVNFTAAHYALLLETYLNCPAGPDLPAALQVLVLMASSGKQPTAIDTRSLFTYFCDHVTAIPRALDILAKTVQQGQTVPIALLNVLIEAYVTRGDFANAFAVYKQLDRFKISSRSTQSRSIANMETFHHLLTGARDAQPIAIDEALFLASEIMHQALQPDDLFYDTILLICIGAQHIDEAVQFCEDMLTRGMKPPYTTQQSFLKYMETQGDERCEHFRTLFENNVTTHVNT